ncbi:MAG: hypothetical protein R6U21_07990 [Thermoplasmatota archaeon]
MDDMKQWTSIICISIFLMISVTGIQQTTATISDPPYIEDDLMLPADSTIRLFADTSGSYYNISATSALAALGFASTLADFEYKISDEYSFGLFVYELDDWINSASDGWQYWVNYPDEETPPMVAAEDYELETGDTIDWFYGGYGVTPETSEIDIKLHITVEEDTTPPVVEILSPKTGGFYLFGSELSVLPIPFSFVIGELPVSIHSSDDLSRVHHIEIFMDGDLQKSFFTSSFQQTLTGFSNGKHTLTVVAHDGAENNRIREETCFLYSN